jgi:hypothetical protein
MSMFFLVQKVTAVIVVCFRACCIGRGKPAGMAGNAESGLQLGTRARVIL